MKRIALIILVLSLCLLAYNISQIDLAELSSKQNQHIYINLAWNAVISLAVLLTYISYTRRTR